VGKSPYFIGVLDQTPGHLKIKISKGEYKVLV
jgi:hypothetical protein